jgi:NAD(P)-dependent dehydrogenase (short-subunit alcohol dehydrogenase family)
MSDTTERRFAGRTVVVTGAGSGIGRATAERIVAEGGRVVAGDLVEARLADLRDALGPDVVTVAGDVSDSSVIVRLMEAGGERIDGLANVAGIMDGFLPTAEIDDETWDRVLAVNLTGMMKLTRAVLPAMIAAGRGSIVNVSSEAGQRASCAGTAYTTSKHAVNGFTRSTAFFYTPKGVRCNAVAPGAVATGIDAPFRSPWAQERLGPFMQVTVPGVAQASELAAAITWLLSDDASNVSGVVLPVDGGWAAV